MAIKSYKQVIDAFELFADNHQMVNAFSSSFFEQFDQAVQNKPNWPIIYVIPDSITFEPYINSMRFRVYCVDLLQRDRSNESDILNDCIIILKDLYNWVKLNDYNDLNILNTPTAVPVNNFLTELTVGWYIDLDIEVQSPANECDIPFEDNFILTGVTCSSEYAVNLLTCATLESCGVILALQGEVISGGTYSNVTNTLTLNKVNGSNISIPGFSSGGGTTFTGGTVTGPTIFTNGLTANTFSATTYLGLPTDVFVTGGTYSNGSAEFINNTGGTFSISGFSTGGGGTGGGSIGSNIYFNLSVPQSPYREISEIPTNGPEQTTGVTIASNTTGTIASFLTPVGFPNLTAIPAGVWSFFLHSYKQNNNATFNIFCQVYSRTSGGVETLLFSSDPTPVTSNSPIASMQISDVFYSGTSLNASDRLLVKVVATNTSNQSHIITFLTEGTEHYSYFKPSFIIGTDVFVSGGTYSNGTAVFTNTTGGTFSLTGFTTQLSDLSDIDFDSNIQDGQALIYDAILSAWTNTTVTIPPDTYTTGATYSNGTATFTKNDAGTYLLTGLTTPFTGGVVSGLTATTISATTISGTTLFGNGSNLTGIGLPIVNFRGAVTVVQTGVEVAFGYYLIPANTFTTSDIIQIDCAWDPTDFTVGALINCWFRSFTGNTPTPPSSGQLLALIATSGQQTKYIQVERKNLYFSDATTLRVRADAAYTDMGTISTSTIGTPTFNTAVDNYIYPTMRAGAGASATLRSFIISKK